MPYRVFIRPAAEEDLRNLYDYIAEKAGRSVAGRYVERIEAECMKLADFPERGTMRNEIFPGLRVIGFERRAAIAFVVEHEAVRILRILYGGQAFPEDWSQFN